MKKFAAFLLCLSLSSATTKAEESNSNNQTVDSTVVSENLDPNEELIKRLSTECQNDNSPSCIELYKKIIGEADLSAIALHCHQNRQDALGLSLFHAVVAAVENKNKLNKFFFIPQNTQQ
jgi:hypothetical protein